MKTSSNTKYYLFVFSFYFFYSLLDYWVFLLFSVEEILATITEAGFKVAMQKEMQLTREMAEDFYKEHIGQEYFEELITRMTRYLGECIMIL